MAMRRPLAHRSSVRVILGCALPCLALGLAAWPSVARAQYMALTAPPVTSTPRAPEATKPAPSPARSAEQALDGPLPHQRTGPSRLRVVRDICIGCDR